MWPTPEFNSFEPEERVNFFRGDVKNCRMNYAKAVANKKTQEKSNETVGELRPLAYWVKLGYDEERIKNNTPEEDKGYTEQEGATYRVRVKAQKDAQREQWIQDEVMQKMRDRAAVKKDLGRAMNPKAQLEVLRRWAASKGGM